MTSNIPDVSERLSHAFANWQMYYFGHELEVARSVAEGKATNQDRITAQAGSRLARTILDNSIKELQPDDWKPRKELLDEEDLCGKQILGYYEAFPLELFTWNRKSRRAFHLPISLEAMLAAATFPEMEWEDVLWPHDSFVISLEKPIKVLHPRGVSQSFDTMMVSRLENEDGGHSIHLRWFQVPPKKGMRQGYSLKDAQRHRELLKKNDLMRTLKLWSKIGKEMQRRAPYIPGSQFAVVGIGPTGYQNVETDPAKLYKKLGDAAVAWENQDHSTISYFECLSVSLRIAVGWMMYLETLSSDSIQTHRDPKQKTRMNAGGAPGIITEPDGICEIIGKGRIDPSETTQEPGKRCGKGFVRPHWRRAHYKRPTGSSPGAPRTLRIPPVLVRADLVPLYGIISGTNTIVISED